MKWLQEYWQLILICCPGLMTIIFYQLHVRKRHNKWKAIHFSVQYSAIFYVIATSLLLHRLFSIYFIGVILIILILILAIILIIQWKQEMEVILVKGLKILWRITFLLFFLFYAGLFVYMFLQYLLSM